MKPLRRWTHTPMRIGTVVAALLLVSAAGVRAGYQNDQKKAAHSSAPAHQQSHEPAEHQQAQPQVQHQQTQPQMQHQQTQPHMQHQQTQAPVQQQAHPQMQQIPAQHSTPQTQPNQGQRFGHQPETQQPPNQGQRFGGAPQQHGEQFGRPSGGTPAHTGYTPRPGVRVESAPGNREIYHAPNGGQVHMDHGRVVEVHTAGGAVIHHGPEGYRSVEVVRPGGRTVVVSNYGGGYVQRSVVFGNHSFVQRTYVVNGVVMTRLYRPFVYRPGLVFNLYTPVRYYRPGFYFYAYNPWVAPVFYNSWGWNSAPWYGFYAGYFTPAPSYASPAFWLTDYIIADVLQDAYQQRMAASQPIPAGYFSGQPGLTPDVKQAIATEVGRQLRQEEAEAQMGGAAAAANPFTGGTHIFVANGMVEGIDAGQACAITAGDVLEMRGAPPLDAVDAPVLVRAGKRGGCRRGEIAMVQLQDLAEMQNHMREVMDRGLAELQRRHGQGGLPPMNAEAIAPPTPVSWAAQVRPDVGVENELSQVSTDANRAEQETVSSTVSEPPPSEATPAAAAGSAPSIGVGSSIDDVVAAWGLPLRSADLGGKKIYIYKDVKVTFQDGKVIDVQ